MRKQKTENEKISTFYRYLRILSIYYSYYYIKLIYIHTTYLHIMYVTRHTFPYFDNNNNNNNIKRG